MSEFTFVAELPKPRPNTHPGLGRDMEFSATLFRFADAMRARPQQWAIWPRALARRTAWNISTRIVTGRIPALPGHEFEGRSVNGVAYVRYIGPVEPTVDGPEDNATDRERDEQIGVGS